MLAGEAAILSAARFTGISFLWYNVIGAAVVIAIGSLISFMGLQNIDLERKGDER
jgi:hypothetical protein